MKEKQDLENLFFLRVKTLKMLSVRHQCSSQSQHEKEKIWRGFSRMYGSTVLIYRVLVLPSLSLCESLFHSLLKYMFHLSVIVKKEIRTRRERWGIMAPTTIFMHWYCILWYGFVPYTFPLRFARGEL